jgi:cytochrome b561
MPLRNRPEGYGVVTRVLHWSTVAALVVQVVVGYAMDWDDDSGPGLGDDALVTVHLLLGVTIILLGLARWAWRRIDSLPAWAESLSDRDRRFAHRTERVLLALLVVVPATGIVLVLSGDDDLVPLHVAGHVALYVAVAAHLGLVLRRRLVPRMLWGPRPAPQGVARD